MSAIFKHSTFNIQHPVSNEPVNSEQLGVRSWMLNVECSGWVRKGVFVAALFTLLFFDFRLLAQPPTANRSPGRYLFIVDTSAAMRTQASAVRETVDNLLHSGMHAQLQRGDSIGVWTYHEQLHAGDLPVQQWSPEHEHAVASNIVAFLKSQKYEKKSRFDTVGPELQRLVKESERLTVLLITDGSEPVSGTPFDSNINEFFNKNSWKQKQKRMPITIVLRSFRGKFASFTINPAPWPVQFPDFPPAPKVAAKPKSKPPPKQAAPPPTAPPLIVVGEPPEPAPVTPVVPAEPTETKPASTEATGASSNPASPSVGPATPNAAKPTEAAAPTSPATTVQPKPDAAPAANLTIPEPKPAPPNTTAAIQPPPTVRPAPTVAETVPVEPLAQTDQSKSEPESPTADEPPPTQVATATQPESRFNPKLVLVVCAVAAVLVFALFLLLRRRAHAVTQASLITRSMDQDKK